MDPQRWKKIERLCQLAMEVEGEKLEAWLKEACAEDEFLHNEVLALLQQQSRAEGFLEDPAIDDAAKALAKDQKHAPAGWLIGQTISHYRTVEKIGEGGMGIVFRAEDTKLNRLVAIKVLPDLFSGDPVSLARFEREARLLASLNHPHIATIHGLEQAEGTRFLVMEIVDGETLAQRIAKGPLPMDEAFEVCRQIAEGIEAAHEKSIIHRDLKPANIKITAAGKVKILDFGLAKALQDESQHPDPSHSPTPADRMTHSGVVLGTAPYMSPEQVKAKAVDQRADIWAFGCILFECLTGKRVFDGETASDTMAAILTREPEWQALPATTSWMVRNLLRRCLNKNPKARLRDIGDARIELEEASQEPVRGEAMPGVRNRWGIATAVLVAGGIVCAVAAAALIGWRMRGSNSIASAPIQRTSVVIPADDSLFLEDGFAISPDGQTLAFVARSDGSHLYIRHLNEWKHRRMPGTDGAYNPLFSPDGKWVAFGRKGNLEKVPLRGGPPQRICSAGRQTTTGTWGSDGNIIFTTWPDPGIRRVSADGGTPEVLLSSNEGNRIWYLWPERLPGDQAVLFTTWHQGKADIAALVPGEREPRTIIRSGAYSRYLPTGQLLYVSQGHLHAAPFDLKKLEIRSGDSIVIDDIADDMLTTAYDISTNGTLVYIPAQSALDRLVWKDRRGVTTPLALKPRSYSAPRLSPDGRSLVVTVHEGPARNVWTASVEREPLSRLTFSDDDWVGIWTPDGRRVTFGSGQGGRYNVFWTPADGSGKPERLTDSQDPQQPTSWSPDGNVLLYHAVNSATKADIWHLSIGSGKPRPFIGNEFAEGDAVFAPDGRWVAYSSSESGKTEVYVQPYPGPGARIQISTAGGGLPRWNRNGRELFYRTPTAVMAVPVEIGRNFRSGVPVQLFTRTNKAAGWDVSPDGQRFLMIEGPEPGAGPSRLNLVHNWFAEIERLCPTDK